MERSGVGVGAAKVAEARACTITSSSKQNTRILTAKPVYLRHAHKAELVAAKQSPMKSAARSCASRCGAYGSVARDRAAFWRCRLQPALVRNSLWCLRQNLQLPASSNPL